MNAPISAADIISWFRSKAKEFNTVADNLEKTFSVVTALGVSPMAAPPSKEALTKETIHKRLKVKLARLGPLSEEFGVTEEEMEAFIKDPKNELTIGDRGWIQPSPDYGLGLY